MHHLPQLGFHLARHAPHLVHHLVHFGLEKYGEVKQNQRIQQERGMGEHLAARYPSIEKAADDLRRREPALTKEQAIAKATLDEWAKKPLSHTDIEVMFPEARGGKLWPRVPRERPEGK